MNEKLFLLYLLCQHCFLMKCHFVSWRRKTNNLFIYNISQLIFLHFSVFHSMVQLPNKYIGIAFFRHEPQKSHAAPSYAALETTLERTLENRRTSNHLGLADDPLLFENLEIHCSRKITDDHVYFTCTLLYLLTILSR